jgi:hypothetical protein
MSTMDQMWALSVALSQLQGTPSTGKMVVRSTGATGTIPALSVGVPVNRGAFDWPQAVFVTKNRNTADRSWPVTSAGTEVTVETIQGGAASASYSGAYKWFPAITGIEEQSTLLEPLTAGVDNAGLDALKDLRFLASLQDDNAKNAFLKAGLGNFPAALLVWSSTAPLGGPGAAASPGPRAARMSAKVIKVQHNWSLFLVSARMDSQLHRALESTSLRDSVLSMLSDCVNVGGWPVSMSSSPTKIIEARVADVTPTSCIEIVRFQTIETLEGKVIRDARRPRPWNKTRTNTLVNDPEDERDPLSVPDQTFSM